MTVDLGPAAIAGAAALGEMSFCVSPKTDRAASISLCTCTSMATFRLFWRFFGRFLTGSAAVSGGSVRGDFLSRLFLPDFAFFFAMTIPPRFNTHIL
jgi:hypothetical protein